MAAGPLPLAEALRYAVALAEALCEVHSRGRVYAFLRPAGVAIGQGQVRLVSCGPAAVSPYFSPEQVEGRDLDPRSDIFALGALLHEMLSGRPAFDASTRTALRMEILHREPAPLQNAPPALARLVRRCLEKKPERRVQRTEILLAELKLQEILARPLIPARPEAATRDHSGPAAEVKPARFQRRFATRLSMRS
jgi:serine/threonine protein kinase